MARGFSGYFESLEIIRAFAYLHLIGERGGRSSPIRDPFTTRFLHLDALSAMMRRDGRGGPAFAGARAEWAGKTSTPTAPERRTWPRWPSWRGIIRSRWLGTTRCSRYCRRRRACLARSPSRGVLANHVVNEAGADDSEASGDNYAAESEGVNHASPPPRSQTPDATVASIRRETPYSSKRIDPPHVTKRPPGEGPSTQDSTDA